MALVYSYNRFSSVKQERGDSLRRQKDNATKFVAKYGHTLDTEVDLTDPALSAFHGANVSEGKLGVFLEAIKLGKVKPQSILYVESLDRISRQNLDAALSIFQQIVRAGITIHTAKPERSYDLSNLKSLFGLIEPLVILERAHEESKTKSGRVKDAIKEKRKTLDTKILTAACPSWLTPKEDRTGFDPIKWKTKIIKDIFLWSKEGLGYNAITKRLNKEKVPPIARAKHWQLSYVARLLNNRALIGEYQPHHWNEDQKRVPVGKPVEKYFPQVITVDEFYEAKTATNERRTKRGRTGKNVTNLFQGLLKHKNGTPLLVKDKGKADVKRILSEHADRGLCEFVSTPYPFFEECLLRSIKELNASDLQHSEVVDNRQAIKGRINEVESKIDSVKAKMQTNPDIDDLLELLTGFNREKKQLLLELEQEQNRVVSNQETSLTEAQSLIQLLNDTKPEDLYSVRSNLRQKIRNIIDSIIVDVVEKEVQYKPTVAKTKITAKFVFALVSYKNGMRRFVGAEASHKHYYGTNKIQGAEQLDPAMLVSTNITMPMWELVFIKNMNATK